MTVPRQDSGEGRERTASREPGVALGVVILVSALFWVPGGDLSGQRLLRPLPPDHWSYGLFELLDAAGIPGIRTVWHRPLVSGAMQGSLWNAQAADISPEARAFLSLWSRALEEELGSGGGRLPTVDVSLGWETGKAALPPARGVSIGLLGGEEWGDRFALWGEVEASEETPGPAVVEGGAALNLGDFTVLVGRIPVGLGQGLDRVLLSGAHALDGVLVSTRVPVRLPGALHRLGSFSWQAFLSRSIDATEVPSTWFSTAGVVYSPHPRFQLTAARVTRFAGEGLGPATLKTVLSSFFGGEQDSGADDTQATLGARGRWSLLGQPLATYVTLGFEDPPGFQDDPAVRVGGLLPLSVRGHLVALRYEYDAFGRRAMWCTSCEFRSHDWYDFGSRSYGPLAVDGVPMGSALGGYGSAHRAELGFWSSGHPLFLRLGLFRERREFGNLLVERWPGLRRGVALDLVIRWGSGVDFRSRGMLTRTGGGSQGMLSAGLRVFDILSRVGDHFSSPG